MITPLNPSGSSSLSFTRSSRELTPPEAIRAVFPPAFSKTARSPSMPGPLIVPSREASV